MSPRVERADTPEHTPEGAAAQKRLPPSERLRRRRTLLQDAVNLPNALTMLRVALVPVVLWLVYAETPAANVYATLLYAVAAITDLLDGYLARKQNLITVFGKFMDPLADKLLVLSVLILLVDMGRAPAWAVIVVVAREVSVTALRAIASSEGVVIAAGQGGKSKTALQMVALVCLILHHPYVLDLPGLDPFLVSLHDVGLALLYLSMFFSITSFASYVHLFSEAVEAKNRRLEGRSDGHQDKE